MIKIFAVLIILLSIHRNIFAQKAAKEASDEKAKEASSSKAISSNKKNAWYGVASYYADKFKGRKTANGELYHPDKYTGACNVLPLNTWIKVTNLSNSKSVVVKINDRMHARNKRLVDLSKVAAKKLRLLSYGIIKVKLEVLDGKPEEN